ncbi:hypothetical protein PHBOTO_006698 [Pseudozyma hubeiensis]|nr:hypothetical protein PHBOTO_006698 [Pseudozyma hubeiensis]
MSQINVVQLLRGPRLLRKLDATPTPRAACTCDSIPADPARDVPTSSTTPTAVAPAALAAPAQPAHAQPMGAL